MGSIIPEPVATSLYHRHHSQSHIQIAPNGTERNERLTKLTDVHGHHTNLTTKTNQDGRYTTVPPPPLPDSDHVPYLILLSHTELLKIPHYPIESDLDTKILPSAVSLPCRPKTTCHPLKGAHKIFFFSYLTVIATPFPNHTTTRHRIVQNLLV